MAKKPYRQKIEEARHVRGRCKVCGKDVAATGAGGARSHKHRGERCRGSDYPLAFDYHRRCPECKGGFGWEGIHTPVHYNDDDPKASPSDDYCSGTHKIMEIVWNKDAPE